MVSNEVILHCRLGYSLLFQGFRDHAARGGLLGRSKRTRGSEDMTKRKNLLESAEDEEREGETRGERGEDEAEMSLIAGKGRT